MNTLVSLLGEEAGKCINCGFCESVCPTLPSSDYRAIYGARGRVALGKKVFEEISANKKTALSISDSFYSCLDCYACFQVCPAGVNAGKVSSIMRQLITSQQFTVVNQEKSVAKMIVSATLKYNNPIALKSDISWAKGISFNYESDILLYTGAMYHLMPNSKALSSLKQKFGDSMTETFAKFIVKMPSLLKLSAGIYDRHLKEKMGSYLHDIALLLTDAGVQFTYLGAEEPYPGTFLHDLGYVNEFKQYALKVTKLFRAHRIKRIITVDPHTYELLKYVYPEYVPDFDFEVYHYLDFIKNLSFEKDDSLITYHEPCHFVLRDIAYNVPKEILENICSLKMPARNGKSNMCCGGPDEMIYTSLSESVSDARFLELKGTGSKKIITACPICYINLAKDDSVIDIAGYLKGQLKK
jgi:glycolate oxidase iron-sulfur subunit